MTRGLLAAFVLAAAMPCSAQPRLTNARVTEQALSGPLDATIRQIGAASTDPTWIAWAAPIIDGEHVMCCFSGDWSGGSPCCGGCRLEPGTGGTFLSRDDKRSGRLEPADTFFIFLRVENRRVERVRMFSEECAIDAGGRTVTWVTGVKPAESIALLASMASSADSTSRVMKGSLSALAQHGGAEAVPPLIRLARQAPDGKVRGEALFWLAQRAGAQAVQAITEAIEHDPETDIKKRAVFALSQLPANEGVPKLIEVARSNRSPAVRKQAMFWLGQSKDPRAIAFFEEILK